MPVPTGQEVFEDVRDHAQEHLDRFVRQNQNQPNAEVLINQENVQVMLDVHWAEATLGPLLDAYHTAVGGGGSAQQQADACLQALTALEDAIYQWETAHPATWLDDSTYRPYVRTPVWPLLAAMQTAHRTLVVTIVAQHLTLWTPDRATLGGGPRAAFDAAWTALTTPNAGAWGTGNVRISLTSMHGAKEGVPFAAQTRPHFEKEIFAYYAKILARAQGRALIAGLQAGGHAVLIRLRQSTCQGQPYVQAGIHDEDPENTTNLGLRATGATERTAAGNGTGTPCTVCYDGGIPDGLWSHRDFNMHQIPSPAFVMFAHELAHATHYQAGTVVQGAVLASPDPACHSVPMFEAFWQNGEEYNTITGGENLVRGEHHLLPRTQFGGGLPERFWTL